MPKANRNPYNIKRLVTEESKDVENILNMLPPELVSSSVEKYPIKKKLQELRLSPKPMNILARSVAAPIPTADNIVEDSPPEAIFSIIHAVEKGATTDLNPNQIFNSIFPTVKQAEIPLCSVSPGPLEDIVVPLGHAEHMTEEVLTSDLNDAAVDCQLTQTLPRNDICVSQNITPTERTPRGEQKIPMVLDREIPPWENATIQKMSVLVGDNPIYLLDTSDFVEKKKKVFNLPEQIDFFVDANTTPFETKVQLRGSKLPPWFPGSVLFFIFS